MSNWLIFRFLPILVLHTFLNIRIPTVVVKVVKCNLCFITTHRLLLHLLHPKQSLDLESGYHLQFADCRLEEKLGEISNFNNHPPPSQTPHPRLFPCCCSFWTPPPRLGPRHVRSLSYLYRTLVSILFLTHPHPYCHQRRGRGLSRRLVIIIVLISIVLLLNLKYIPLNFEI